MGGSSKGIYTALSGAVAQSQRLDTIANNLANVNTTSFKKDHQTFKEYLTSYEKAPDVIDVPVVPASLESFYSMQGGDRGFVDASGTYTSFNQGAIKHTGNPLDIGIEGDGFFEVLTSDGIAYTRDGSFQKDNEGRLVTKQGYPVLRKGSGDPTQRIISLTNHQLSVGAKGSLYQGGEEVGELSVVSFDNKDGLRKIGQSFFKIKDNYNLQMFENPDFKLHQGFVEGSNVNVIQEMTDMISASRAFEATQKAIQAYDQIDAKLVNDIPKF